MKLLNIVPYLIVFFGAVNLLRMALFIVGSNLYSLQKDLKGKKKGNYRRKYYTYSVVIPAHNEEGTIVRNVESIAKSNYPQEKVQIIVVDDGSTDRTYERIARYKAENKVSNLTILRQKNSGKANALNNAIKNFATGELVMCLDADSYLEKNALLNCTEYFKDERVKAVASNVKIIKSEGLLNLIQQYEYLVCYQMKRAQTVFNIEYIIGGIGSVFRRSAMEEVGYYDGNTVTEDIDLTMKVLRGGNKENRVVYGADVIAHTEAVISVAGLIKQRYRWKWGRCQTFLKNRAMFFSGADKFTKGLTFFYLPFAIFGDLAYLFEPVMLLYILYVSLIYIDPLAILSALLVITVYISLNVLLEETLSRKEKLFYLLISPTMYFYFYVLSFVEYTALIKSLVRINKLKESIDSSVCSWQHVERPKARPSIVSASKVESPSG
jgi:cellulose synthase/poly-beta-1,6-N-acetylglucosamine synthase-like glycosyltransferase